MFSTQPTATASSPVTAPRRRKLRLLLWANALLTVSVILALVSNRHAEVFSAVYAILLFFICTLPLAFLTNYRGKASLLIIFLSYYYAIYALKDLVGLFSYEPLPERQVDNFSGGEVAILVGAIFFICGYVFSLKLAKDRRQGFLGREWSPRLLLIIGLVCWAVGFYITAWWQFSVGDLYSGAKVNVAIGGVLSTLRFLQPVGSLLLIYVFLTTRNKLFLVALLITMVFDFGLGFFGDSKELALRAPVLYVVSVLLLRERLPVVEIILFTVIAGITFNYFQAIRSYTHGRQESRVETFRDIGTKLDRVVDSDRSLSERFSHGIDYFVNRISLKDKVELIVSRVGKDIEYLNGYSIKPLLYVFIPRLIMPDKQNSSEAGRLFNQRFKLSSERRTYISMSQLGELYWNFGWGGPIVGMAVIGAIMGWLAALFRLDNQSTVIKYLLLLMTIYLLTLSFEAGLAASYIVWARLTVFLLLIHFFVPKIMRTSARMMHESSVQAVNDTGILRFRERHNS